MRRMSEPQAASPARITAAFLTCTVIWGSTFLVIRIGNESIPPFWGAAMRLLIASALLWAWMLLRRQAPPRGPALVAAAQYGTLQFGVNFALLYWGETAVPSGLSAVMYATVQLTTSLLARAFGLERLTRAKVVGALSALAGVGIIFASELSGHMPAVPLFAIFVSASSACLGTVLLKRGPPQSAIGVNALGTAIGFVVCLMLSFVAGESHALPHSAVATFSILYLVVAGSLTAFVLWSWLVLHAPISRISYIAVLVPLCAVVLGAVAVHEHMPAWTLAGAAVVLSGVILGLRAPAARTR
jgi:drug/metabolite transporter (DMT)-like permease